MSERALEAARESGLIRPGAPLLVMVSGGGDSVALLDIADRLGASLTALHVNYGLREDAALDQALVEQFCSERRIPLTVESVELGREGNLQDRARAVRYALAERLAEGDYAAAHTASDQAETVLYRLAVSPGSRALHGMAPRRGRLVRPLLAVTRDEVRDYLRGRGLDWREDPSNADRRFARARVRHDVLEALRELSPAVERTIAETARQLRDEAEVLDAAVNEALKELGHDTALPGVGGGAAISLAALREHPPALQRLVLRALAEKAAGGPAAVSAAASDTEAADAPAAPPPERAPAVPAPGAPASERAPGAPPPEAPASALARPRSLSRREADEILALGDRGTKSLDLGGGLRAVAEYGTLRFTRAGEAPAPPPVELAVPGLARFGDWEVEARLNAPGDVSVTELGPAVTIRAWRDGDRMRPAGLGGTKSLQDLFTDRKVPRALRRTLPVIEAHGEIVWVAGVAVDERFAASEGEPGSVGLSARSAAGGRG